MKKILILLMLLTSILFSKPIHLECLIKPTDDKEYAIDKSTLEITINADTTNISVYNHSSGKIYKGKGFFTNEIISFKQYENLMSNGKKTTFFEINRRTLHIKRTTHVVVKSISFEATNDWDGECHIANVSKNLI